jgi:hypothetical protein
MNIGMNLQWIIIYYTVILIELTGIPIALWWFSSLRNGILRFFY